MAKHYSHSWNNKQNSLISSSNITTGAISSSTIIVDGGSKITEKNITTQVVEVTANLIVEGTNVMTEIGTNKTNYQQELI